ncbi:MAG: SDR family NAD(P)-dependent oxidoreductase [Candidatus Wallbacteria bacterium]|nr:SDR family NAD(P)-dependent oxidoreductase [Candidatus Wallbacteria bacterium]
MILLTGAAGFIGHETAGTLLAQGHEVVGIDNLNDYYDVRIKDWRCAQLKGRNGYTFKKLDIENLSGLERLFAKHKFSAVINLAARAGVRYSMENPFVYMSTNATGTLNLLELCRKYAVKKLVLASTSSLYAGLPMPFSETLPVNTPISPYAASKKAAEAMCYSYHYLYGTDISIVRYFTVYGPAGRPDMSIFRFIWWGLHNRKIEVFGDGSQTRDFTYVTDIARGTAAALKPVGFEVINLGNNNPHSLNDLICEVELNIGKPLVRDTGAFHKADMTATCADIAKAGKLLGWKPEISLEKGISLTVEWMKDNWDWVAGLRI